MISALSIARSFFKSHEEFISWMYDERDEFGIYFSIHEKIKTIYNPLISVRCNIQSIGRQFGLVQADVIRIIKCYELDKQPNQVPSEDLMITDYELMDKIKTFVRHNPGCKQIVIYEAHKANRRRVAKTLKQLVNDKSITVIAGKFNTKLHYITGNQPKHKNK